MWLIDPLGLITFASLYVYSVPVPILINVEKMCAVLNPQKPVHLPPALDHSGRPLCVSVYVLVSY